MESIDRIQSGHISLSKRMRESEGKSDDRKSKRTQVDKLKSSLQELNAAPDQVDQSQVVETICDALDAELLVAGYEVTSEVASAASEIAGAAHLVVTDLEEDDLAIAGVVGDGVASAIGAMASVMSTQALKESIEKIDARLKKNPSALEREKLVAERQELQLQLSESKADMAFALAEAGADLVHNVADQVAKYAPHVANVAKPVAQVAEKVSGGAAVATAAYELAKNVKVLRKANEEKKKLEDKIESLEDGALKETLKLRHAHLTGRKYTLALLHVIKSCSTLAGATGAIVAGSSNPVSGAVLGAATAGGLALYVHSERANIEGTVNKLPLQLRRRKIKQEIAKLREPIQIAVQIYNERAGAKELEDLVKESLADLKRRQAEIDFYATKVLSNADSEKLVARTKALIKAISKHKHRVKEALGYDEYMRQQIVTEVNNAKPRLQQLEKHLADVNEKIAMIDEKASEGTIAIRAGIQRHELARLRTWLDITLANAQVKETFQKYFTGQGRGERFNENPTDAVVTYLFE